MSFQAAHLQTLYEAIEILPDGVTGELLNGQLHTHPRPSAQHALSSSRLVADLVTPFDRGISGPGGWWILHEPEIHFVLNTELAVPDIAGWRKQRMPELPADQRFTVVPDWLCEVLSPSTASKDREIKMPLYAHYGVKHVWIIDPKKRVLEAYALEQEQWKCVALFGEHDVICAPPFEAVTLPLPW